MNIDAPGENAQSKGQSESLTSPASCSWASLQQRTFTKAELGQGAKDPMAVKHHRARIEALNGFRRNMKGLGQKDDDEFAASDDVWFDFCDAWSRPFNIESSSKFLTSQLRAL